MAVCQRYFEKQSQNSSTSSKLQFAPENTLHVGDQFLSAGANDFRARSVGTTAWIASPEETVYVYDLPPSPLPPSPTPVTTATNENPHAMVVFDPLYPLFSAFRPFTSLYWFPTNCRPSYLKLTVLRSDLLDELGDLMYKKLT